MSIDQGFISELIAYGSLAIVCFFVTALALQLVLDMIGTFLTTEDLLPRAISVLLSALVIYVDILFIIELVKLGGFLVE